MIRIVPQSTPASPNEQIDIVELQGTLAVPDFLRPAELLQQGESPTVALGTIERNPPNGKKCVLHITTLAVEGECAPFKKPMMILKKVEGCKESTERKRPRDNNSNSGLSDETMLFEDWIGRRGVEAVERECLDELHRRSEGTDATFEVIGFAKNHYLFKAKPSRVFS